MLTLSAHEGRRGFLVGAAKLVAAGLTLAALPPDVMRALNGREERLLWTPETLQQDGSLGEVVTERGITFSNYTVPVPALEMPLRLALYRGPFADTPILTFAFNPRGGLVWQVPPSEGIVFGNGKVIQRLFVGCEVVDYA